MRNIFTGVLFFLYNFCFSQPPPEWVSTYGGNPNLGYSVDDMVTDKSGNVYVYGLRTDTLGNDSGIIIKYNSSGVQQWLNKYDDLWFYGKIKVDKEGNVYVMDRIVNSSEDFLIVKYNSSGGFQWSAVYNDSLNGDDYPNALAIDDSLNVYVTGTGGNVGMATIKYDSTGAIKWIAIDSSNEDPYDIIVDSLQNVYITGTQWDTSPNRGVLIMKYNQYGNQIWKKEYIGDVIAVGQFISISKDNFIYVGGGDGEVGNSSYLCLKYDTVGTKIWYSKYNWQDSLSSAPQAMQLDDSGNVYLTGGHDFTTANSGLATVKLNQQGVMQWAQEYNGGVSQSNLAHGISIDKAENTYITGQSWDSIYNNQILVTIKYDLNGNINWIAKYGGENSSPYIGLDSLNNVYISSTLNGSEDFVSLKYSWTTGINLISANENSILFYPNPLTSSSTLQLNTQVNNAEVVIYDMVGKEIMRKKLTGDRMEIDRGGLESGVYFVMVRSEERQWVEKMVVE